MRISSFHNSGGNSEITANLSLLFRSPNCRPPRVSAGPEISPADNLMEKQENSKNSHTHNASLRLAGTLSRTTRSGSARRNPFDPTVGGVPASGKGPTRPMRQTYLGGAVAELSFECTARGIGKAQLLGDCRDRLRVGGIGHARMRFGQPLALSVAGHTTDGSAAVSPPIPAAVLTSAPPGN